MVMAGQKGYAVKCTKCGHEDAVFFQKHLDLAKELVLKAKGTPCPECGGTMKVDPGKVIRF